MQQLFSLIKFESADILIRIKGGLDNDIIAITHDDDVIKTSPPHMMTSNTCTDKSFFIVHVGPVKTSTTTIQCGLRNLEDTTNVLDESNITILETESCRKTKFITERIRQNNMTIDKKTGGWSTYDNIISARTFVPNCLMKWMPKTHLGDVHNQTGSRMYTGITYNDYNSSSSTSSNMPLCFTSSFATYAKQQSEKCFSTVISNEILIKDMTKHSEHKDEFLDDLVDSLGPDIQVFFIAYYRHWFEWVISLHRQNNKILESPRQKLKIFPGIGGNAVPTIETYFQAQLRSSSPEYIHHIIDFLKDNSNVELKIVNMNSVSSDPTEAFACEGLPKSISLCSNIQNLTFDRSRKNSAPGRSYFWADQLAVAAYEHGGMLSETAQRTQVIEKLMAFRAKQETLSSSDLVIPMTCPSQAFYTEVWNQSMSYLSMVSEHLDESIDELKEHHQKAFEKAIQSEKFCAVNTTAALSEKIWIDFFQEFSTQHI